ncbi:TIGR00159 family protein [Candidatus Berkelbacteria bacterium]|nr:TIGR00159 family protein [Candidatus Berkelbacteria bacterium]
MELVGQLTWTSVIDISLVSLIFYGLYLLVRETRALRILYGITLLVILYLMSQWLHLTALHFLLQSVFAITLVAIPVVFQPELRAALERLGRGDFVGGILSYAQTEHLELQTELTAAVLKLSTTQTGALIVLERSTGLKDMIEAGVRLDAVVSTQLLLTIFHPNTPLHDGAVIIRGGRVAAANVFLPLAAEPTHHLLGTRHRAALGLTQESDAIILIVSEETGRISLAHQGALAVVARAEVRQRLRQLMKPRK